MPVVPNPPIRLPSESLPAAFRRAMRFPMGVKRPFAYGITAAASLAALFLIPRLIPASPSISDSWLFGFNNRVFVLLLLVFLIAFSRTLRWRFPADGQVGAVSHRLVWVWIAIFFVACCGIWYLVRGLGGFGESTYLIDRVNALAEGQVPYRDFEFAYGPLLIYVPWALTMLHLPVATAYYLFWLITTLVGIGLLAMCISLLEVPGARKGEVFTLFCLFALSGLYCTGVNYSLVRFLAPVAAALHLERIQRSGRPSAFVRVVAGAGGYCLALLLISPEMAIAIAFGSFCWIALLSIRREISTRMATIGLIVLGSIQTLLFALADHLRLLATLREFSRGANSFPVLPGPHILFFLLCCLVMARCVAGRLRAGSRWRQPSLLAAVSLPLLSAAFGRCDSGHVALNGIAILLFVTALLSTSPSLWNIYRTAFFVVLVFLPFFTGLLLYQTSLSRIPAARFWLRRAAPVGTSAPPGDPAHYFSLWRGPAEAPFGYKPNGLSSWRSSGIDTGYFFGIENALVPESAGEKIAELNRHPDRLLLLPVSFDSQCKVDPAVEAAIISDLLVYPYRPLVRHNDDFLMPLCSYIHNYYARVQIADTGAAKYSLWTRK
jgi:hypothetical protein